MSIGFRPDGAPPGEAPSLHAQPEPAVVVRGVTPGVAAELVAALILMLIAAALVSHALWTATHP